MKYDTMIKCVQTYLTSSEQQQQVRLALFYAHEVLPIWEKKYPTDPRPKQAIEAAWQWALNPVEKNSEAASIAVLPAYAAANAANATLTVANAAYTAYNTAWAATADAAAHTDHAAYAITHAALSSQKFPVYEPGQLLSFRVVTTSLQDSESVGPIFLLQCVSDESCTLLDENGKICEVDKRILCVLRPL